MTDSKPLITVVTCTYKRFDKIFECILSVLHQNYPNIEYIITDDGSPNFDEESILTFIESHKSDNIKNLLILTHEKNVGTVKNINGAYRKAQGEYIVNLSGDDIFCSDDVISKIVEKTNETKPNVLAFSRLAVDVSGKGLCYFPHSSYIRKLSSFNRKKQFEKFISGQFYAMFSGSALVYKKQYMESMNYFDENFRLWEDGPFVGKTLLIDRIYPAFDIVGIKYSTDGVSGGNGNPILSEDVRRYNKGFRKNQAGKLGLFYKALTFYNIRGDVNFNNNEKLMIAVMIIPIMVYKLVYRFSYDMTGRVDKLLLRRDGKIDAGS